MVDYISAAEFEKKMKELSEIKNDKEGRHIEADKLMCQVLKSLGYSAGVKVFESMGKWYA